MKKPNSDIINQYIYDGKVDELKKHWNLDDADIDQLITHKEKPLYYYNTTNWKPLSSQSDQIAQIIAKHYKKLYQKYVGYFSDEVLRMSQTAEDIFHTAIIRTMETEFNEVTTESVLRQLNIEFYTALKYNYYQHTEMKKSISGYMFTSKNNKPFIPSERDAAIKQMQEE